MAIGSEAAGERRAAPEALDVSVVMPCLNEAEAVGACVQRAVSWLKDSGLKGEVIVVDNGSTDGSAQEAERAGARVVALADKGYGRALLHGFREARGKYLVMGDCDGTYEFGDLDPLIMPLMNGYDLVMGNRLSRLLAPGAMPWAHRFIGTPIISFLLRVFTGAKVTDSQCGIRGIRRASLQQLNLKAPGMEFASEMILKAMRNNLRLTEVDVPYYPRTGESKLSTFRDGWRHLKFLLVSSPSYVFIAPGLLFVVLGLIFLAVRIFTAGGIDMGGLDWEPVYAAAIFLVVGVNTLMLGVCSKLLGLREEGAEDSIVHFYRKHLGLGRLLVAGALLGGAGLGLDLWVFAEWLRDAVRADERNVATVAASLMIMAANLIFAALAAAMIDPAEQ